MTLEQIIELFEKLENGEEPSIDYSLHGTIGNLMKKENIASYHNPEGKFSIFLKALRDHEPS